MPFDRLISRLNTVEEGISKLEHKSAVISWTETQREERLEEMKQIEQNIQALWDNIKLSLICLIRILEEGGGGEGGGEKRTEQKKYLKKLWLRIFQN